MAFLATHSAAHPETGETGTGLAPGKVTAPLYFAGIPGGVPQSSPAIATP